MTKKKRKSGLKILIALIAGIFKILWKILTFPYTIYKLCTKNKKAATNAVAIETPVLTSDAPIYKRKYLLTKHEWNFYKALKPVADKLELVVLAKIRMADLVETVADSNSEYYRGFGKVKAKHVDFALARPENLYVELLIELDDNSHKEGNERDTFVESVYTAVGYKLFRTRDTENLEQRIITALA